MTCDECRRILLDGTSGPANEARMPGGSLLALAELHAQGCRACANKSSDLARLLAGFDQLRAYTSQMEAPARVEKNLLAAFRRSSLPNRWLMRTNLWRFVLASAAALVFLVSGITLYTTLRPKPPIAVQGESLRQENKGSEEVLRQQRSPVLSGAQSARTIGKRVRGGARHRRPSQPSDNLVARDNPASEQKIQQARVLPGEQLSLNGGSSVIRVNLPLSSLAAVGVPMVPDLPDRQVTADVALDPFGAIIAIRLVEVKPGEGSLAN